jgi:ATP synthase protein I
VTNLRPPPVYKVIVAQFTTTGFLALSGLFLIDKVVAYSVLLGGVISALPNSYFVLQAFRFQGARNADRVVKSFIRGELGKIGVTIILFALSFTLITNLSEIALILGFIAVHFAGVVMSGFVSYSPGGKNA